MDAESAYPRRPMESPLLESQPLMEPFIYDPTLIYEPNVTYDPTLNDLAWNIMPPQQSQPIHHLSTHQAQSTSQVQPVVHTPSTNPKDTSDRGIISPACTACRERHLKCDGVQPVCSRCMNTAQDCQYVRSRRGHRPPRKKSEPSLRAPSRLSTGSDSRREIVDPSVQAQARKDLPAVISTETSQDSNYNFGASEEDKDKDMALTSRRLQRRSLGSSSPHEHSSPKLQELYYTYFNDAHPILIPQAHFNTVSKSLPLSTSAIIDYIGACYSSSVDQNKLRDALEASLFSAFRERNGHTVQALILLAIAQHSTDLAHQACQTLDSAIDLALELGMNKNFYRCDCCNDNAILRESWRRTWWELYITDGILAAVHMKPSFRLHSQPADVALPCEEAVYRAGPGPNYAQECRYINEMDEYAFLDDEAAFSSYAYRITAIRELGNLLKLNLSFCPDSSEIVHTVDASLTNWLLHLPESKVTPLDENGKVDEMMFQAHMIINAALIFLHRPRSDLIFTSVKDTTSCTPARRIAVPASRYAVHTAKAIEAADRIASMVTLPGQLLKHTPLFTCMVTLAAVVHLSAYVINRNVDQRSIIKERLLLSIGALKSVREIWPVADSVLQRVRGAAREILTLRQPNAANLLQQQVDPELYSAGSCDIWLENVQDSIFSEIAEGQTFEPLMYHTQS
ncbi:hypothetical protein MMC11_007499 [Xylographa trunciseda]|nr:hypothetical protein [Xylographa trunciseda]